jgi:hypothetical protein
MGPNLDRSCVKIKPFRSAPKARLWSHRAFVGQRLEKKSCLPGSLIISRHAIIAGSAARQPWKQMLPSESMRIFGSRSSTIPSYPRNRSGSERSASGFARLSTPIMLNGVHKRLLDMYGQQIARQRSQSQRTCVSIRIRSSRDRRSARFNRRRRTTKLAADLRRPLPEFPVKETVSRRAGLEGHKRDGCGDPTLRPYPMFQRKKARQSSFPSPR